MVDPVVLPTFATEVASDVESTVEKILDHHKKRGCHGLAVVMIFRNGDSVTFASKAIGRRDMLGAMLDMLLDYQTEGKK